MDHTLFYCRWILKEKIDGFPTIELLNWFKSLHLLIQVNSIFSNVEMIDNLPVEIRENSIISRRSQSKFYNLVFP